jgi:hypothetical protein
MGLVVYTGFEVVPIALRAEILRRRLCRCEIRASGGEDDRGVRG